MFNRDENKYSGGNFTVRLRKEESTESMIRRFLKKTKKERIIEEVLERKRYKKPTTKKREAKFRRELVLAKLKQKENQDIEFED